MITLHLLNDDAHEWIKHVDSTNVKHVTGLHVKSGAHKEGMKDLERGKAYETDGTAKSKGGAEEMNDDLQKDTEPNEIEDATQREDVKRTDDNDSIPKDIKKEDIMKGGVSDVGTIIRTEGRKQGKVETRAGAAMGGQTEASEEIQDGSKNERSDNDVDINKQNISIDQDKNIGGADSIDERRKAGVGTNGEISKEEATGRESNKNGAG